MWEQHLLQQIAQAEDANDRAFLTILLEMAKFIRSAADSSDANAKALNGLTDEFRGHRMEFNDHVTAETAVFARGQGMIRGLLMSLTVISALGACVVALGLWIVNGQFANISQQAALVSDQQRRIEQIEIRQQRALRDIESLLHK